MVAHLKWWANMEKLSFPNLKKEDKNMKNEKLTEFEVKLCKKVKKALVTKKGGKMLVYVRSVAPSGMSRTLRFNFVNAKGDIYYMDYLISKFCGIYTKEGGVRVRGCGMDMIFHTLECFLAGNGVKEAYKYAGNYTLL